MTMDYEAIEYGGRMVGGFVRWFAYAIDYKDIQYRGLVSRTMNFEEMEYQGRTGALETIRIVFCLWLYFLNYIVYWLWLFISIWLEKREHPHYRYLIVIRIKTLDFQNCQHPFSTTIK
jgi:hypothetical protein